MKVYNLNEITDSKVLYDKSPPRFMVCIVFVVLLLMTAFIIWSTKSVKTYMVKGQGTVTTDKKFYIMAKVSGEINEVFIEEGKEVKQGEVLLTINAVEAKLQSGQADSQINIYNKRIDLLTRAENDAAKGENSFDKNNTEEAEFYNKLEDSSVKAKEYAVDEEALKKQGATDDQIKQYKISGKNKADDLHYTTILDFTNEKKQLQLEKSKLETQKVATDKSAEEFKLYAAKSGKVHLNNPLTKGMVLQAGNLIGAINSPKDELIVETLISGSERPRVHLKDEVSILVAGLNQAEYGTIKGKVVSIDEDATIDNQKGNIYFKLRVKPEKTYLTDKKGEKVNLTLGMIIETRVKYEKINYMKYFLEQIGVNFN